MTYTPKDVKQTGTKEWREHEKYKRKLERDNYLLRNAEHQRVVDGKEERVTMVQE